MSPRIIWILTIRSHPHVCIAFALGAVGTMASMHFLKDQPFLTSLTIGTGVTGLILMFHPLNGPSIELEEQVIRLKNGDRCQEIPVSAVAGYRIERVMSLSLKLILKNGHSMVHPLDCIVSLDGLEHELQEHGILPLREAARRE